MSEEVASLRLEVADLRAEVTDLRAETADLRAEAADLRVEANELRVQTAPVSALARFDSTERWLAASFDGDDLLVSVVLATYDRPTYLRRAIASVLAQVHPRLEVLVVDAGGRAETAAVVASFEDPRVRLVPSEGTLSSATRNRGRREARGDLVAYLDDDNAMLPWWLRSVACVAARNPSVQVFNGANVLEGLPADLHFGEATQERLRQSNPADTSALAHRRDVPVLWPETVHGFADWEFLARLVAAGCETMAIPVRACLYCRTSPDRFTHSPDKQERFALAQARVREVLGER